MPDYYFWIVTKHEGQPVLIFGDRDENIARQKGIEQLNGIDFKLVRLPTKSLPQASRMMRGKRLEEDHDLSGAMKHQLHERSVERIQRERNGWM